MRPIPWPKSPLARTPERVFGFFLRAQKETRPQAEFSYPPDQKWNNVVLAPPRRGTRCFAPGRVHFCVRRNGRKTHQRTEWFFGISFSSLRERMPLPSALGVSRHSSASACCRRLQSSGLPAANEERLTAQRPSGCRPDDRNGRQ